MHSRFSVAVVMAAICISPCASDRAHADVKLRLADGFDFPVGRPDAKNYYKARGFWPNGHLGEDWNGNGGGNTDLGDPVYSIADGVVVHSKDMFMGWGNVVIIRHVYRETDGSIKMIDSLYGHLNDRYVTLNQRVRRGQKIGTIGTAHGRYLAHLHFEIRKNLAIGMNRSKFPKTYAHYHDPTKFIRAHRNLNGSSRYYTVATNTFAPYGKSLPAKRTAEPKRTRRTIPVDESRREEIKRIVANTTSPSWTPPPASTSKPKRTRHTQPTTPKVAPLSPKAREIVVRSRPKPPPSRPSNSGSSNATPNTSNVAQNERTGFWKRFSSKFRSSGKRTRVGRKR